MDDSSNDQPTTPTDPTRLAGMVSVVVTVLNDAQGTARLLDALRRQTLAPAEVIIVDGGSTDATNQVLENADFDDIPFRYLRLDGANIAEGRNHGIAQAGYDIIACTDAGSVPDPQWLWQLSKPFVDRETMVVGGSYAVDSGTRLERVVGLMTMPGQLAPVDPLRFNPSARSLAFRREAWTRAAGFPDWLYTAEDTLFDCKLRKNCEHFEFAPQAVVRWSPRGTVGAVWRQFRDYARGEARIGRRKSSTAFWVKRYLAVAAMGVAGLAASATLDSFVPTLAALSIIAWLLITPVQRKATTIAKKTSRPGDWIAALLVSHLVAAATVRGHLLGYRDRRRDPGRFVDRLRAYWGEDTVRDVPLWNVKHLPIPRTLIVSWHWPPTNRASANVLGNLFGRADPTAFRVLTRRMPLETGDALPVPPLETEFVTWPRRDDREVRFGTWIASTWTALRMLLRARRIHKKWNVQRVLAVYPHRFSFATGWLTARWLGVPLVAYMHDLFSECSITSSRIKRSFWSYVDREALESAWLVLVPTREFADHYRQRGVPRTWVLPHCLASEATPQPLPSESTELRLLYAGSIYQAHEEAVVSLVTAADPMPDVELLFLTPPNRVLPDHRVRWEPRPRAIRSMGQADVLVVALSQNAPYPVEVRGCFPSKIVDYLSVGRPILAVVPPDSFVDRFVRETGCGLSVTDESPTSIAKAVDRLRDPELRATMSQAAQRTCDPLSAALWMTRLGERLALGLPSDPYAPPCPTGASSATITATASSDTDQIPWPRRVVNDQPTQPSDSPAPTN